MAVSAAEAVRCMTAAEADQGFDIPGERKLLADDDAVDHEALVARRNGVRRGDAGGLASESE